MTDLIFNELLMWSHTHRSNYQIYSQSRFDHTIKYLNDQVLIIRAQSWLRYYSHKSVRGINMFGTSS